MALKNSRTVKVVAGKIEAKINQFFFHSSFRGNYICKSPGTVGTSSFVNFTQWKPGQLTARFINMIKTLSL